MGSDARKPRHASGWRLLRLAVIGVLASIPFWQLSDSAYADSGQDAQFSDRAAMLGYRDASQAPSAGRVVCSLLDRGVGAQKVQDYVTATFQDSRANAGYYAALFAQAAVTSYCPGNAAAFSG